MVPVTLKLLAKTVHGGELFFSINNSKIVYFFYAILDINVHK